jgi:metal-responsive CopG/Arc/MetJ family transcriptional regulator
MTIYKKGGHMGNKLKVTITIDEDLVKEIDMLSKERTESRSHLIEEAIKLWKQKQLEKELSDGYLAMAKEDVETAEANLEAGIEVLR